MKILYLSHTDIRSDSRILKSIQAAIDSGYDVSAIGIAANEGTINAENGITSLITTLELYTRRWTLLPKFLRHVFSLIELTFKALRLAIYYKPDLIHCNDTIALPLCVFLKMHLKNTRLIYDAHELESNRNGLSRPLGLLTFYCEKILWHYVDSFITVSPSIQTWYLNHFSYRPSTVVLNAPVYKKIDSNNFNYLRKQYKIPNEHKIFIYIGIIAEGRGIDLLLDVFSTTNIKASIIFLGYGNFAKKIEIASSNFKNIYYHTAVSHDRVVEIASSADYGFCLIENVSLSDYYSLPNKLFEYLFAGLPVIASNFPDIKNLIYSCNAGLCTDLDVKSILNTVNQIVESNQTFEIDMHTLSQYDWGSQKYKLLTLYSNTLAN